MRKATFGAEFLRNSLCTVFVRFVALCLCLISSGCGRTYWYNPNPNANFAHDNQLSWNEAKQKGSPLVDFISGGLTGVAINSYTYSDDYRDPHAYNEAIRMRGWRQVSEKEAIALGIVKPENINFRASAESKMIRASEKGNLQTVQTLLAGGANVNAKDPANGKTALMWAAQEGHTDVVKFLLEKGADATINAENTYGVTALMMASRNGYTEVVKLLLEKDADVNAESTIYGVTALMMASQNGHTEVVKLLLEKGADINATTKDGKTALEVAKAAGNTNIVELLEKAGTKK